MEIKETIEELQKGILNDMVTERVRPFRKGEFDVREQTSSNLISKLSTAHILSVILERPPETLEFFKKECEPFLGAAPMDTETEGEGAELTARAWLEEAIKTVELKLQVADLHPTIVLPQETLKIPRFGTIPVARKAAQGAEPTDDVLPTGEVLLDPVEIIASWPLTYTLVEDSVLPLIPTIKEHIRTSIAKAIDRATIDGDTAADHQDADVTATDDARKLWDGYRKLAISAAKIDFGNATVSLTLLRNMREAMGKYAVDPDDVCWLVNLKVYHQMLSLGQVETVDKFGEEATVRRGQLRRLDGIEIRITDFLRTDLNASGVYDGTTTDRTICLLVRRDAFRYGRRRDITIEMDKSIKKRVHDLVATARMAFQPIYDASTEPIVALGYNIAT